MLDLLLKGIITGFILSIMVGPVFFVLLQTSIKRGIRSALALDLGVLLSDLVYVLIAYLFYSEVSALLSGDKQDVMKVVGGSLFLIYGTVTFFKRTKEPELDDEGNIKQTKTDYALLVLKGFLLNFANPMVIFYWISVISFGDRTDCEGLTRGEVISYYLVTLFLTFFAIDVLKIIGAKKLRPLVTEKILTSLNHLIGITFFLFGIYLVAKGLIGIM